MTTIITKNGTGVPSDSSLSTGELAVDTTNGKLYTSSNGTNVVNVGSSTGIDDNATSTAVTISSSQKVGIGTDSPQQLLEVSASLNPVIRLDSSLVGNENDFDDKFMGGVEWYTNDTSGIGEHIGASLRAFSNASVATVTPGYELIFSTSLADVAESEAMRIDGDGNVGIGGTPNNNSGYTTLTLNGNTDGAAIEWAAAGVRDALIYQNGDSDLVLQAESTKELVFNTSGESERMRIDSSGNVGIGTSSPQSKTTVAGAVNNAALPIGSASASDAQLRIANNNSASYGLGGELLFEVATAGSSPVAGIRGTYQNFNAAGDFSGTLVFGTQKNVAGGILPRMTIDEDGFVGIGTDSPDSKLVVSNGAAASGVEFIPATGSTSLVSIERASNAFEPFRYRALDHRFETGASQSESMRLDSSGELHIAGTSDRGNYKLQVNTTGVWGQGSYINGSDARWKDNVQTLDCNCLDIVNNLRSVSYTYNEDSGASDLTTPHLGFIAQEVEQATGNHPWLSGLVTEDFQGYKSMAYQELIPVLTKAIQEQQVMIEELKAEVAALKGA